MGWFPLFRALLHGPRGVSSALGLERQLPFCSYVRISPSSDALQFQALFLPGLPVLRAVILRYDFLFRPGPRGLRPPARPARVDYFPLANRIFSSLDPVDRFRACVVHFSPFSSCGSRIRRPTGSFLGPNCHFTPFSPHLSEF